MGMKFREQRGRIVLFLVFKSIVLPATALTSNINSLGVEIPPDWPGKLDLSGIVFPIPILIF